MQKSYSLVGQFTYGGTTLLGLMGLLSLILMCVKFPSAGDWGMLSFFVGAMSPFWFLGGYWVYRHSGRLTLTDEAVILQRLGREQRMAYRDVVTVQEEDGQIPPNFVLRARDGRALKFTRQIPDFLKLYALLCERIPVLQMAGPSQFPVELRGGPSVALNWGGSIAVMTLLILALGCMGFTRPGNDMGALFGFIGLLWAIVVGAISFLFAGTPLRVRFTADEVVVRRFLSPSYTLRFSEVAWVRYGRCPLHYRGITRMTFEVTFGLVNGKEWTLSEEHIKALGQTPEKFWKMLVSLYQDRRIQFISEV